MPLATAIFVSFSVTSSPLGVLTGLRIHYQSYPVAICQNPEIEISANIK
jgi:hypothetical protein